MSVGRTLLGAYRRLVFQDPSCERPLVQDDVSSDVSAYIKGILNKNAMRIASTFFGNAVLFDGVTDGDLVAPVLSDLEPKRELTFEEVRWDISILSYALNNGYGGRKYTPQNELREANERLAKIIKDYSGPISSDELCKKIWEALKAIPDNHMGAFTENVSFWHRSDEGGVGKNVAHGLDRKKPYHIKYLKVGGRKIPIISITSMPYYEDAAWKNYESDIKNVIIQGQAIIIDVRGNGGGSDSCAQVLAAFLYGHDAPNPIDKIVTSQTPATIALSLNRYMLDMAWRKGTAGYLQDNWNSEKEKYDDSVKGLLPSEYERRFGYEGPVDTGRLYSHPIYILADRKCASSCEMLVEFFEGHPNAITVGENTGGYLHFGNLGEVFLPHSNIFVNMATDFWVYKDGRYLEFKGIAPKVRTPKGEDALDTVKHLLEK